MKAVILAGGEGTRLRPLTYNRPKPMVPILNRPFLEHVIDYLKRHNITDIVIAMCYLPHHIRDHFGDGSAYGVRLTYVVENSPLGTAGAVKNVEKRLDETFFVFNGDIFTDLDLTEMLELHQRRQAKVTIALTPVDNPTMYGIVETDADNRVQRFVEKPYPEDVTTNMVNAGTYIIAPQALDIIPPASYCMFERDVFPRLVESGEPIYSHPSNAYWIDIGTPEKYLKLHHDLLRQKMVMACYTEEMHIEEGCRIHPRAEVKGPVFIGRDCVIEPGAVVNGPSVIGHNCYIGTETTVDGAIVWKNSHLGHMVSIRSCVIAENVRLGDRSKVMEGSVLGDNVVVQQGETLERNTRRSIPIPRPLRINT